MAPQERKFCCGCLLEGRKLRPVEEFWIKQCFLQIISEIPMCQPEDVPICLCWECEALVRRFTEFKQQVKYSYITLQEYGEWKPDIKLSRTPKLRIHNLFNINYPDIEENTQTNINTEESLPLTIEIKQETTKQVKYEIESISDHDYEDDNLLISYVTKKKKAVKRKKKKPEPCKEIEPIETQTEKMYKEIELTEIEIEEERREMGMRDEYVNAMFRCEKCIMSFPNADDLKDHIAVKHELNAAHHVCPICTCSFVSEISYNYHTNKHKRRYDCCLCHMRFRSKRAALKHYETTHGIDPSYGNDGRENSQTEDTTNINEVKSEGTFPCEQCAKTFRWKTSLRKHLEKHRIDSGEKRRPYCEPCKLSFTTTSNLQKHVKTSSKHQIQLKLRKLKDTLPEDATTPEKQQAHIEEIKCSVNNSRQQYPCAHCGKRFQWRGNLLRHLHSHAARANGELVCTPCNRTFSSLATYKQHMRLSRAHVSEQEFPHQCAECGRRFANKTRLKDHVDWDHRRHFAHHCTQCQKVFKSHTSLYLHKQVVHKKENAEHLCDHCGKPFPNHAKLRSHIIALHTSESPYKCTSCAARFSWHSCLSRHVRRVHKRKKLKDTLPEDATTPEKQQAHIEEIKCSVNNSRQQYPCAHCGKRFQWRGNLLRHLHSHAARANGELVCTPCNRTFSSLATYKQHMRLSRAHVSEQEFPHQCAECGRRFANKTRLKDHVDWDHRRHFAHHCTQCQKVFKSHTSLYLHKQVVHKKENAEHLCDHCGKPFPNHAKLRSHIIALHTSESPYKCTSCAARFSWHSCLSRHVRRVHKRK